MCRIYFFVKKCPWDSTTNWVPDYDLATKTSRCICRLARRGQWGTCPNFDKHFARGFRNDLDVRDLHCPKCVRRLEDQLLSFEKQGGWGEHKWEPKASPTHTGHATPKNQGKMSPFTHIGMCTI